MFLGAPLRRRGPAVFNAAVACADPLTGVQAPAGDDDWDEPRLAPPAKTGIHVIDAEAAKLHAAAVGTPIKRRGPAPQPPSQPLRLRRARPARPRQPPRRPGPVPAQAHQGRRPSPPPALAGVSAGRRHRHAVMTADRHNPKEVVTGT
ncbi:hypothetical protein GCM10009727_19940 [Actinomadura napierensis]|uniref:Uncharacterized protein n=1 Tax=Actinomadura napierensis TaxID=267854 RepID=A0ABN2YNA9_9ACTN